MTPDAPNPLMFSGNPCRGPVALGGPRFSKLGGTGGLGGPLILGPKSFGCGIFWPGLRLFGGPFGGMNCGPLLVGTGGLKSGRGIGPGPGGRKSLLFSSGPENGGSFGGMGGRMAPGRGGVRRPPSPGLSPVITTHQAILFENKYQQENSETTVLPGMVQQ